MEGGWWEGRVDEKLGWFPCVFTKELDEGERRILFCSCHVDSVSRDATQILVLLIFEK